MQDIAEITKKMKLEAPLMAASSITVRNHALEQIKNCLLVNKDAIFEANQFDLNRAKENEIAASVQKRLKFDEGKLRDVALGLEQLMQLDDPVGKVLLDRELDSGLRLQRISCPIGVIGIIFEARPDALVQITSLCIKSGNVAIVKGGKETAETNRVLFELIHKAATEAGLPELCLYQAELHSEIDALLECNDFVDLLIPRGSNEFVKYITTHTQIPVMGHTDGICHTYVDADVDFDEAISIIVDAKTQYPAACNATETVLVARQIARHFLPRLAETLMNAGVKLHGTKEVAEYIECEIMDEDAFRKEYLDLEISIKLVENVDEAISHINRYGSHHTDCILTKNQAAAEHFMQMVDSAGVYQNCSTRFADGFRYGFGAEVGISTSKIHARGPVGLDGLLTYKYKLYGSGQIVGDYASGKSAFHFKDLS